MKLQGGRQFPVTAQQLSCSRISNTSSATTTAGLDQVKSLGWNKTEIVILICFFCLIILRAFFFCHDCDLVAFLVSFSPCNNLSISFLQRLSWLFTTITGANPSISGDQGNSMAESRDHEDQVCSVSDTITKRGY